MLLKKKCFHCTEVSEIELDDAKAQLWYNGALIQDVWPEKSADERELMINGTHPHCWTEMFGEDE